jgi:hypothetical protein
VVFYHKKQSRDRVPHIRNCLISYHFFTCDKKFSPYQGIVHQITSFRNSESYTRDYFATVSTKQTSCYVRVPKDRSLKCDFGKSSNRFEVSQISFGQIVDLVSHDTKNAFFTLGDHVFRQTDGVPIGGFSLVLKRW